MSHSMSWMPRFQPYCQAHAGSFDPVHDPYGSGFLKPGDSLTPLGSSLLVGQSATIGTTEPGSAVFTYSAAFGKPVGKTLPVDFAAQDSSLARHEFRLFASPWLTPTIPNACPAGYDPPHCGHAMSLPVVVVPGFATAGRAPAVRTTTAWRPAATDPVIATVNGVPITTSDFEAYAAVFPQKDGSLRMTREVVLTSLVNQAIASQEAARRGIAVGEDEVDRAVQDLMNVGLGSPSVLEGGEQALRVRVGARLVMERLKAILTVAPTLDESTLRQAYDAGPALHAASFTEVRTLLAERISKHMVDTAWSQWLLKMQSCSTVVILDSSLRVAFDHQPSACP